MTRKLILLVALSAFLPGCPVKGSAFEPSFPETASSGIGPASP